MRTERNIGIDFLRVVLMFLIVFGHCCCHGVFEGEKSVLVAGTATFFAVDAFAFISGWYSIRTTFYRFVKFVGLGLFWAVIVWLLGGSFRLSMGWYGNSYLALMLLAPYVNAGVETMFQKSGARGLGACCAMLFAYIWLLWLPLSELNICVIPSGFGSKTTFTLLAMYILGRTLAKIVKTKQFKTNTLILAFIALEGVVIGWSGFGRLCGGIVSMMKMWMENSPASIITAVVVFMIFERIKMPTMPAKAVAYIAPSMFSVYLLHEGTGYSLFRPLYSNIEAKVALIIPDYYGCSMVVACFAAAFAVFVICLAADVFRRKLLAMLISVIRPNSALSR